MTQKLTNVRKHFYAHLPYRNQWIADIVGSREASVGYIQPNGTGGEVYGYDSKEEAAVAAALYGAKTSAGKPTCGGCKIQPRCGTIDHEDTDSGFCLSFEAKTLADETKETNPKDIIGMKKAPMSTLSAAVLFEMGLGMLEGARKYGRHNYRAMGVSATVYYDAAMGHLMDWFEGEDIDLDSGMSHITKAMTTLLVLRDSMLMENWVDDRPLRNPNKLYKKSFNPKAKEIIEKYPDCVVPYLENNKDLDRSE